MAAAAGTRIRETVEPQVWEEGRTFPGSFTIDDRGPAKETAQNWRRSGTVWTDGSRLGSGAIGAACAWQTGEGWTGRRRMANGRGVDGQEVSPGHQQGGIRHRGLRDLPGTQDLQGETADGRRYTIFSDCQPAIRRALSDAIGPCQQWARAIIELATRLIGCGNEVPILWVPAHVEIEGNEVADGMAKEAAAGQIYGVPDQVRWQASLPHLSRRATERRSEDTSRWIREHVGPERRYVPPGGPGFRRRAMRRVRKSVAQRYYQLLSGHAATGSFLRDRMTGPQRLETDECWWCNCGKR